MADEPKDLEYATSEFVNPRRRWRPGATIGCFVVGVVAGFFLVMASMGVGRVPLSNGAMLVVGGASLAVGVAFAAAFGREPLVKRVVPPTERVLMMRCRDCGQLTPHVVRRQSPEQCTVECRACGERTKHEEPYPQG